MLMMFVAAAAQSGGIATNSLPPETAIVSLEQPDAARITTAPRIVAIGSVPPFEQLPAVEVAPIAVLVRAGDRLLFSGTLRVASGSGASYSENRSEASRTTCPTLRPYESTERSSLSIQLYLREDQRAGQAVNVNVNWQRPAPGGSCGNDGTRSVQLSQTVQLQPGQNATVEGDAGLVVNLSRR